MVEYFELEFPNNDLYKGEINTQTSDFCGLAMYLNHKSNVLIMGTVTTGGLFDGYCASYDYA
jgi:hypothetical protein